MWNTWIGQIQQKIDTAVDVLRESELNEDEEYENEVVDNDTAKYADTGAPLSTLAPCSAAASSLSWGRQQYTTGGGAALYSIVVEPPEEEVLTSETAGMGGSEELKAHLSCFNTGNEGFSITGVLGNNLGCGAAEMQDLAAGPLVEKSSATPQCGMGGEKNPPLSMVTEAKVAAGPQSSSCAVETFDATQEALAPPPNSAGGTVATVERDDVETNPRAGNVGSPSPIRTEGTSAVVDSAMEAPMAQPPASLPEEQLLRWQRQLAEEMTHSAALSEENLQLKKHLQAVTEKLSIAEKRLLTMSNTKEDVPLLLQKLEREKEHRTLLINERKVLREKVSTLASAIEGCYAREAIWASDKQMHQQMQSSFQQQHMMRVEEEQRQKACLDELRVQLSETQRARDILFTKLQGIENTHNATLEDLKSTSANAQRFLKQEVEKLKMALHQANVEYDRRTGELEQQLHEANQRAHEAETRLSDLQRSSACSLRDLGAELAKLHKRVDSLSSELNTTRHKHAELLAQYTALKQERNSENDVHQLQAIYASTSAAFNKERQALVNQVAALEEKVQRTQGEADDLRQQCARLEDVNTQLQSTIVTNSHSTSFPKMSSHLSSHIRESDGDSTKFLASFTTPFPPKQHTSVNWSVPPPNPFLHSATSFSEKLPFFSASQEASVLAKNHGRMEKEIVRQAVEIEQLKKDTAELVSLRQKFAQLSCEHDVLLQMYGQLEEERKSQATPSPSNTLGVDKK